MIVFHKITIWLYISYDYFSREGGKAGSFILPRRYLGKTGGWEVFLAGPKDSGLLRRKSGRREDGKFYFAGKTGRREDLFCQEDGKLLFVLRQKDFYNYKAPNPSRLSPLASSLFPLATSQTPLAFPTHSPLAKPH